jgi:hypothetical protein
MGGVGSEGSDSSDRGWHEGGPDHRGGLGLARTGSSGSSVARSMSRPSPLDIMAVSVAAFGRQLF